MTVSPRGTHIDAAARLAVLGYLIAVPATGVWAFASGHDFARVLQMGLCVLCALAVALRRPQAPNLATACVCVAALLLALAATVQAPEQRWAQRELALALGLASVTVLVAHRLRAEALLATVSIGGASYAALTLVGLATNLGVATALRPFDLLVGYDNGRFFNHVQTSMLPLLAIATVHPFVNRVFNRLAGFALVMGIALLLVTEGRATGVALTVAAAVSVVCVYRPVLPIIRSFVKAGGIAAVVYLALFVALPKLAGMPLETLHAEGLGDAASAHSRVALWHIAWAGIERSPWLGIGPMHFSHTWNSDAAHPHNVYLQVAEEWGVPMLCLLLGVALVRLHALVRAVRAHSGDEAERTLGAGLFLTLVAIGVDGFFSGNFVMPVSQIWIAVVVGAAIGWMQRTTAPVAGAPPTRAGSVVASVLRGLPLAATLWLAASVAPELGIHFLDRPDPAGIAREAGAPRFWSNGWF